MRIWSLHPKYLDSRGLVALWREGLLAQAVLEGRTKGYTRHPQLTRFRERPSPVGAIASYLQVVHDEAAARGFHFSAGKINPARTRRRLDVTRGQLEFEWNHLMQKLRVRDPGRWTELEGVKQPQAHPLFRVRRGQVAAWEKGAPATLREPEKRGMEQSRTLRRPTSTATEKPRSR
jgi:hypothetical protein